MTQMRPPTYHGGEQQKGPINGHRPTPLRINRDSRTIQKPSLPNSHSSASVSALAAAAAAAAAAAGGKKQNPVIIYAHSPKVIHTKPRDFMALVQKLTGLSGSQKEISGSQTEEINRLPSKEVESEINDVKTEDNESAAIFNGVNNQFLAEMPLFTPNSSNFFCSPRTLYSFVDDTSPSLFDAAKKELPQYSERLGG